MLVENQEFNPEQEYFEPTLDGLLEALEEDSIKVLPAKNIREELEVTGNSIVTRDFNCGIRISRSGTKKSGYEYTVLTTNVLADPEHPLSRKYAKKKIAI